jgi:hypothetical protein
MMIRDSRFQINEEKEAPAWNASRNGIKKIAIAAMSLVRGKACAAIACNII